METIPSEEQMVDIFLENWKNENNSHCIFAKEVKFHQKRIDLVQIPIYKNKRMGISHSIEFKIRNWKHCLVQAKRNRLFTSKNTIAIWNDFGSYVNIKDLKISGIGLIEVSYNKNNEILKPKKNPYLNAYYSRIVKSEIFSNLFYEYNKREPYV